MQRVVDEVRAGNISEERIDESVRRILEAKQRYGILDWQPLDPATAAERVNADAHAQLFDAAVPRGRDRRLRPQQPRSRSRRIARWRSSFWRRATRFRRNARSTAATFAGRASRTTRRRSEIGWAVENANSGGYGGGVDAGRDQKPGAAAVGQRAAAGKNDCRRAVVDLRLADLPECRGLRADLYARASGSSGGVRGAVRRGSGDAAGCR